MVARIDVVSYTVWSTPDRSNDVKGDRGVRRFLAAGHRRATLARMEFARMPFH